MNSENMNPENVNENQETKLTGRNLYMHDLNKVLDSIKEETFTNPKLEAEACKDVLRILMNMNSGVYDEVCENDEYEDLGDIQGMGFISMN